MRVNNASACSTSPCCPRRHLPRAYPPYRTSWLTRSALGAARRSPRQGLFVLFDLADEAKAFAGNRLDQGLVGTGVADRMPDRIDAAGERRLGHDSPFPDGVEQIILADHSITVVDQIDEQIEDLRPHIDQLGAASQLAAIHVYRISTELKSQSSLRLRRGAGDPRVVGKSKLFQG
jgi:hypothetical protein